MFRNNNRSLNSSEIFFFEFHNLIANQTVFKKFVIKIMPRPIRRKFNVVVVSKGANAKDVRSKGSVF